MLQQSAYKAVMYGLRRGGLAKCLGKLLILYKKALQELF
jgi:hypothetical protein